MRRQARHKLLRQTATLIVLIGLTFSVACRSCRPTTVNQTPCADSPAENNPVFINQPVNYCVNRPIEPRRVNVQMLVDSSGSMIGFQKSIPQLLNWAQHSFSLLNTSALGIQNLRFCQFSQALGGIANCSSGQALAPYRPSGNTNIHEAIRAAIDYDLSLILTDGIAATGKVGVSDCAQGVDIACVAHALRDVMHSTNKAGTTADWGLWLMPLIAGYDGTYYTEEPMPVDFQEQKIVEQIRTDLGFEVDVTNPRTRASGDLIYQYRGPRALLLIVIARWTDVGRSSLQALWERAEYLGLKRLRQMREFTAGTACVQPLEAYPGFLNTLQWQKLTEPSEPGERSGTIDVALSAQPEKATIQVSCPTNATGAGIFTLNGQPTDAARVAGCVPINLLPGVTFQMRAAHPDDEAALAQFMKRAERQGEQSEQLRLCLACRMDAPRFCKDKPVQAQWVALMNYKHAAEGFASGLSDNPPYQLIRAFSTTHPSLEPHRIYGFSATLSAFYRDIAADQRSVALSQLDFCHQQ